MGEIIISIIIICFFAGLFAKVLMIELKPIEDQKTNEKEKEKQQEMDYEKPRFKPLTPEQIEDIHARGKITPAELVQEWENMDLCAPGNAIGRATWRCRKFHRNCHDCLIDYANERDEYTSIYTIMEEVKPYKLHDDN